MASLTGRRGAGIGLLATATALLACGAPAGIGRGGPSAPAPVATGKAAEPNTLHGVYSQAEADSGLRLFRETCSECHETRDWTTTAFRDRWEGASVYRLWHWIYGRMPHGRPGTLEREQVTAAVAYILRLNGLPPGSRPLGEEDDDLDDYWILWPPTQPP